MTKQEQAKKIAREHGVKGFKKLKLKRDIYHVGRQCRYIEKFIALRLLARLESIGFRIGDKETAIALANKGLLDIITLEDF